VTTTTATSALAGAVPASPYPGLAPYSAANAAFFFGRDREREVIIANLMARRLTLVYGESGVGKSSLLHAGVLAELQRVAREQAAAHTSPEFVPLLFAGWRDDPIAGLVAATREAVGELVPEAADAAGTAVGLHEAVAALTGSFEGELLILLDQFEEYFLYHPDDDGPGSFAAEFPRTLASADLPVNFLLCIREDALAKLDYFKTRIPGLFANYLRIEHLDREAAEEAILEPIEELNRRAADEAQIEVEPALVDAVLEQVAAGRVLREQAGAGVVDGAQGAGRVETPYLQLVMSRLWDEEMRTDSHAIRVATLERLGGANEIVRTHLDYALAGFSPEERRIAAEAFHHLVTPSGTKIAHRRGDLAAYTRRSETELSAVLDKLSSGDTRIVRPVAPPPGDPGSPRYEIFHDVLADAVLAWRARHEAERALEAERTAARNRQRRLVIVAAAALVALAVTTAIAAYALSQRTEANRQERAARARELSARALVQLEIDPQQSLAWALEAAELEPTRQAEVVLRRALLEARLRRVLRVGAAVPLVSYSPDGSEVLLGKRYGGAVVWDSRRRRVVRTLGGGSAPVMAVAYDRSGKRLLTAQGSSLWVWERSPGGRRTSIPHPAAVADASFSVGGSRIVTASADGTVRIFRTRDGRQLRAVRFGGAVGRAVLSPDGRALVTVVTDREGHVQSRFSPGRRAVRVLDRRGVADVEFSPDGKLLATSNYDGTTHLWNGRTGALVRTLDDDGGAVVDLDFSPDGSFLATASSDGGVRVWRVATGDRFFFFIAHTSAVHRVVFDPTGTFVVSVSGDRTGRVWQTAGAEAGKQVALLVGHTRAVRAVAVSPDGRSIVTAGDDGTVRIWDGRIEQRLEPIARLRASVEDAQFTSDGEYVVAGGARGSLLVRTLGRRGSSGIRQSEPVAGVAASPVAGMVAIATRSGRVTFRARGGRVVGGLRASPLAGAVRFAADGRTIAVAAATGTVGVWRVPTGMTVATLRHPGPVSDTALFGGRGVTAGEDGLVRIWDVARGRLLHALRGHGAAVRSVAFSPRGDVIASGAADGAVRLWTSDGTALHVLRGHAGPLTDVRFDQTGRTLVTTSENSEKNAMLWDVRTGRRLHELVGHFGTVTTADFSADGRWIVTAGPISAGIWRADTGRLLFYLRGHTDLLTSASFSPRRYDVLTSARDGTVRLYRCEVCVPLHGIMALARERLAAAR
jgi:WD40 repeat protein